MERLRQTRVVWLVALVLILSACSGKLRPEEDIRSQPHGVAIGSIQWHQGGRVFIPQGGWTGTKMSLSIRNTETGKVYASALEGEGANVQIAQIALPHGRYVLERLSLANAEVNRTMGARIVPWLWNIVSVPFGVLTIPSRPHLWVNVNLSHFVIQADEAVYFGALSVEIPDPLPMGSFTPQINISDEGEPKLDELRLKFPGIRKIDKQLVRQLSEGTDR